MLTFVYLCSAVALDSHKDDRVALAVSIPFLVFADWYFGI